MPEREPVEGTANLFLTINVQTKAGVVQKTYILRFLDPNPDVADPAWRMTQIDTTTQELGNSYDVHLDRHGGSCTCPDYIHCRQNTLKKCKHVEALRKVGLLQPMRTT